jgi:dTDP-4-dehydrorhamnose reductase
LNDKDVSMRVLVLGGTGMLGHKLWQVFSLQFDTFVSLRGLLCTSPLRALFASARTLENVSADEFATVDRALESCQPDVVVNAIGIVKQRQAAANPLACIAANAEFPHRLAALCRTHHVRLIHISTDCVFSGSKGNYCEDDLPDPTDLYGRSKLLGEIAEPGCLTVRTSIIGPELGSAHGLIAWFFQQDGRTVHGYRQAIFSGLTTRAFAELLTRVIADHPQLSGIWHVASPAISKYELLKLVKEVHRLDVTLRPDDSVCCDRSLNGRRFERQTNLRPPPWPQMIERMCA